MNEAFTDSPFEVVNLIMPKNASGTVYFDNAATTAPLAVVTERLVELSNQVMGNSHSAHKKGRQALEVLDQSHETMGRYFDVPPSHVVFTSGGTESNNLAIWGALGGLAQAFHWLKTTASDQKSKLITSTIEHAATGKVFESLECMGAPVAWLGVDADGFLNLAQLEEELSVRPKLISIHHAQNEIGVVQDIKRISQMVRAKYPDTIIHIDAVQSYMKVPFSIEDLDVDMVSISAHKLGGPKGIGALVLGRRFENRNPKIGTLINGSPQQSGMRPGTVPVPTIGAFVAAVEWGVRNFEENRGRMFALRERLASKLPKIAVINGPGDLSRENHRRAPQTLSFSIPGLPSPVTVEALSARGFCVSSGAACNSTNPKPNETLMEMGVGRDRALSAVRVSFSPFNTLEEVDAFAAALEDVVQQYG
jgi:cysteine desulfurase